jgi:hypothetical protein
MAGPPILQGKVIQITAQPDSRLFFWSGIVALKRGFPNSRDFALPFEDDLHLEGVHFIGNVLIFFNFGKNAHSWRRNLSQGRRTAIPLEAACNRWSISPPEAG